MKRFFIVLLIVFALVAMSSCTFLMGLFVPYVGVWERTYDSLSSTMKEVMTLSINEYEAVYQMEVDGQWVDFMAMKGTLDIQGEDYIIAVTHYKSAESEVFPEDWTALTEEETENLTRTGMWELSSDKDTLALTDSDPEGGESEKRVYTRVE